MRSALVDAAFAPVFRYFDTFDRIGDFGFWHSLPKVQRWRASLAARPSVLAAVSSGYADRLRGFLLARGSALSQRMLGEDETSVPA